jgi:putative aldouronate transport system substrate-binding protein
MRVSRVLLVLVLLAGAAVALSATPVKESAQYEIKMLFPGDTPIDMDLIVAEAEKRVKDTLNVKLNIQFIPWSDYGNKVMTKISAGEDFDLHLNAPWLHMQQLIDSGAIQAWDTLIDKYAPNVKGKFDKQLVDANRFNGKIMGIPLIDRLAAYGFVTSYRGDLAKAVGITQPIMNQAQMDDYLYKVKAKFPAITPISWLGSQYLNGYAYDPSGQPLQTFMFGQNNCFVPILYKADGTVDPDAIQPIYAWKYFVEFCKRQQKLYKDGIIDKDVMAQTDIKGALIAGKTAMGMEYFDEPKLQANVPGAYTVYTFPYKNTRKWVTDFKAWNFLCLNTKCKDPERVTRWYDWNFADQKNFDLINYGIEGKHWVDKGNMTYDLPTGIDPNKNYNFPGYVLNWNPKFLRASAQWPPTWAELHAIEMDSKYFVKSQLAGFNPDYKPVENEIAKCSAVWAEAIFTVGAGVVPDVDKALAEAKQKLEAAGYLKIVEEAKKQIKAFIAAQK